MSKKDKGRYQDPEGRKLWQFVVRDVTPLDPSLAIQVEDAEPPPVKKTRKAAPAIPPIPKTEKQAHGFDLDRRTEEKFRKGQMTIDAILDLHGLRAAEAHEKLIRFILNSYKSKKRCLLVITGKGSGKSNAEISSREYKGVIRSQFKTWLEDISVKPNILSIAQAKPNHGGAGAFYILLRRQRE